MKKLFVTSIILALASFAGLAQDDYFTPTDTWPYAFESFRSGVIHFEAPYEDLVADINICVADGHLHYLENGVILESETKGVIGAEVNGKTYRCYGEEMMEVIVGDDNGFVGKLLLYDPSKAGQVDIGFGISSSTFAASSVDLSSAIGLGSNFVHAKVADVAVNKDKGEPLTLSTTIYIVAGDKRMEPVKRDFQDLVGKDEAAAFLKDNKVKWNSPETLLPVVDFIATH